MKRLLTIMILAPMFAGAQVTDSAWKAFLKDTTRKLTLWTDGSRTTIDTTSEKKYDTIPVRMLVVDTCSGAIVQHTKGYMVRVTDYWSYSFYFLTLFKKRFSRCVYVWDFKEYP